ncbi:MAG TPA: DNA polymerase IV [Nocardioidaceae bacterium]|nr:DNA polymerase IV [Nocardioidaceae bacterium]
MNSTADSCSLLHVDMDAFYASMAVRDHPELAGLPVIVGGGSRGVVLSATYRARESGVHSAMPMTRARRLCPQAVVVRPDFERYSACSAAVMETFHSYTPKVQALSLDEAFLDVSGARRRLGGDPVQIAEELRARIHDEQGITCSVGVAATTLMAKLASRSAKPDGVLRVTPAEVTTFLHPLPVEALWGVGDKTGEQLRRLGLTTVGDIAHTPVTTLRRALGPAAGAHLHVLAWGGDDHAVVPRRSDAEPERSIGSDETFGRDTDDPALVRRELLRLSAKVSGRMRAAGVAGRTVTLRIRFADFVTITRSRTLSDPTDLTAEIYAVVGDLYAALRLERARLRLVGVRVEGLIDARTATRQLLLGDRERGWSEAERAVDRATRRFGDYVVRPGSLIGTRRP